METSQDSIQLLNTAIIKCKEKSINTSYEERLAKVCKGPAVKVLAVAIKTLAENEKISQDRAAQLLVETVRELDSVWNDYVMMEGISNLKSMLKESVKQ